MKNPFRTLSLPADRRLIAVSDIHGHLALLRALLCQPVQTLLLDEPFTGMDPELVSHAAAAVVRLAARRDTVLVTHDEHAADLLGWPVVRLETVGK